MTCSDRHACLARSSRRACRASLGFWAQTTRPSHWPRPTCPDLRARPGRQAHLACLDRQVYST